ncbi:MAG: MCE family protein [Planctomycetes bacterium]|nr:MCE family protein [Planctomycetota bacterium]
MPRNRRNEALVGAFIAGGLLLFTLLLFLMGSLDALLARSVVVEADFGDVQGLQMGDPVLIFGQKVGKVDSIALLQPEEEKRAVLRVGLKLPVAWRRYLREDSVVKIDKTLTGNISVLVLESEGKVLPEGARLKGTTAADFAAVTQRIDRVLEEGEKAVGAVSRIVRDIETKGEVTAAISEVAEIARRVKSDILPIGDQLKRALEQVQGIIEENRLDVRHTVANLKETSGLAKSLTEKLGATPEQIDRSLEQLRRAGASVGAAIDENRVNVDSILEDLRQVAANASNLTAEVKRRPWRLLYRPSAEEEKAMELYDAAWAYNLGATELNRAIQLLAARLAADPEGARLGKEIEEARKQVSASLRKHRDAEERFWEKMQAGE